MENGRDFFNRCDYLAKEFRDKITPKRKVGQNHE